MMSIVLAADGSNNAAAFKAPTELALDTERRCHESRRREARRTGTIIEVVVVASRRSDCRGGGVRGAGSASGRLR
jgi:hypothetical protein